MSYTELMVFHDGKAYGVEYRNAWGGAARIWTSLFDAYVPKKHPYDSWMFGDREDRRLWDLATCKDVPMCARSVLAFTFDIFFVKRENLHRFASDLRAFVEKHPANGGVDHLPAWAQWIDENENIDAVGLYATSVGDNQWYRAATCPHCENDTDDTVVVPLADGKEVYDWLAAVDVVTALAGKAENTPSSSISNQQS